MIFTTIEDFTLIKKNTIGKYLSEFLVRCVKIKLKALFVL